MRMVAAMQGADPFGDSSSKAELQGPKPRSIPPPSKLPPLTPEVFDAMFPGKPVPKRGRGVAKR